MLKTVRVLRLIVASPGDVFRERSVVQRVASELNRTVAADRNLRLEIGCWETDAYPAFHVDGPQGLCDEVLKIVDCDVLVGIFWSRFGTATRNGMTGTEHEINLAIRGWRKKRAPQVMIFFNTKAPRLKSGSERRQWAQVAEYREKMPAEGLFWEYKGSFQFEPELRKCLENYICSNFPVRRSGNSQVRANRNRRTPSRKGSSQIRSTRGWRKLTIDPRVPPRILPQILIAFSEFARQCGAVGIEVTLSKKSAPQGDDE